MPSVYNIDMQNELNKAQEKLNKKNAQPAKQSTATTIQQINDYFGNLFSKPAQTNGANGGANTGAQAGGAAGKGAGGAAGQGGGGSAYTGYSPSQAVLAAQQYLQQQIGNKPGAYSSKYDAQLDALLAQMMNRGPFEYDATADPLYNIYKDLYIQNGRRAMQDTMGNAAALAGGYGSSYAQSAAQQMYNQYMEGLNSVVPQLQQQAYQRYSDEGDRMAQNFQLMNALEQANYARYRDTVGDWQTDRNFAYQQAYNAEQMDRQQYQYDTTFRENQRQYDLSLAEQKRQADLNEAFRQAQLAESIRQYDQNFAENVRQANLDEAYRQAQAAEAVRQYNQNFGYQQQQDALAEAYRQAQLAENQRQFNMNFGEEGRQYDANLAEKIRQFDIAHALDQAKFDQQVKQYNDALAQQSGGGGGGSSGSGSNNSKNNDSGNKQKEETALDIQNAVSKFVDYVPTETQFIERRKTNKNYQKYGDYEGYIVEKLSDFIRDGRLTNNEALGVIQYYTSKK